MRVVVLDPRTVSSPVNGGGDFTTWVEVTFVVRLQLPDWGAKEVVFLHWAAPWREGEAKRTWRPFDPGRRAVKGETPLGWAGPTRLSSQEAEALVHEVRPLCPRELFWHRRLGLVARLGESFSSFRHRCLKTFAPLVQEGLLRRDPQAAREVARVMEGIECHLLQGDELQELEARVGLVFYPSGTEPGVASENLMIERGTS